MNCLVLESWSASCHSKSNEVFRSIISTWKTVKIKRSVFTYVDLIDVIMINVRKSKHSGWMMKWAVLKRNCWDDIHTDAAPDVLPSLPELLGYGYALCILFNFFNSSYYWRHIYFIDFGTMEVYTSCYFVWHSIWWKMEVEIPHAEHQLSF